MWKCQNIYYILQTPQFDCNDNVIKFSTIVTFIVVQFTKQQILYQSLNLCNAKYCTVLKYLVILCKLYYLLDANYRF